MLSVSHPKTDLFKKPLSVWTLIEIILDPLLGFLTFYAVVKLEGEVFDTRCFLFSLIVFLLTFPGRSVIRHSFLGICRIILFDWILFGAILLFFMWATNLLSDFPSSMLYHWLIITPIILIGAHYLVQCAYRWRYEDPNHRRKAIIVGKNEVGFSLARAILHDPLTDKTLIAFFDDRSDESRSLSTPDDIRVLNIPTFATDTLDEYANQEHIDLIYICLPMMAQPRITQLLSKLQDTTTSIYFVPDIFITDLIQARIDRIANLPVVAVRETPFYGSNSLVKRMFDIGFSIFALILMSPVMILISLAIKLTSPGPILFKQRRYGLDGHEILVYKFRSMNVMEEGDAVQQATQNDTRVTQVGAFLRRTSLDELPQFFNVLTGVMSVVGPRPHAISHNEQYRKLISGYMVRHKVKPGITGLAQVNGYRGETETLEKMENRIRYDLEYLRTWSLGLDIAIIIKTVMIVIKGENAY